MEDESSGASTIVRKPADHHEDNDPELPFHHVFHDPHDQLVEDHVSVVVATQSSDHHPTTPPLLDQDIPPLVDPPILDHPEDPHDPFLQPLVHHVDHQPKLVVEPDVFVHHVSAVTSQLVQSGSHPRPSSGHKELQAPFAEQVSSIQNHSGEHVSLLRQSSTLVHGNGVSQ